MTTMHGFELIREQAIPELNTQAKLWRHIATGAELLSLENDDVNKSFGITFRTPPSDSTGVPHIIEHSVLSGSRKYPLKEPFVQLLKGSLQTFLNAMTFGDKTVYLFASQNLQDFYNLLDVYLDAVLYPLLSKETYQQEAWHYELERESEPMIYKGVVFNEMKGAYSSPDALLYRNGLRSLFPDTIYGNDSGGDPRNIPDLTYEQFTGFHRKFYHPSNALIFFYGDDDPEERLRVMDNWLREFQRAEIDAAIPLQPRFSAPKRIEQPYAVSDTEANGKGYTVTGWMLDEITDPETALGLTILSEALLGTPVAPLRKALLESGLGENITGSGASFQTRQATFSTGLKGIDPQRSVEVEQLILQTLEQLAQEGIDQGTIDAAVNTVEFELREMNTGNFPRGLALMMNALVPWLHGHDPMEELAFEEPLTAVKAKIAENPRYLSDLIRNYLIDNPHRVSLLLKPEQDLAQREAAAERERLDQARAAMTENDVQAVIETTHHLQQMQETPDSPEELVKIPRLQLADLPRENKIIPLETGQLANTRVLSHDIFTNGIVYLDLGFDLHHLPEHLVPYVPLFGRALLELGTEKENAVQLIQRIGRLTGGIRPQTFTSNIFGTQDSTAWLFLSGKATIDKSQELLAILNDILLTAKLDNKERFRQMVLEEKASREAGLIPGGSSFAFMRLRSHFTEAGWATEQMSGVSSIFFLRDLAQRVESDWQSVLSALEEMRRILINRNAMVANITLDEANWKQFEPRLETFLANLPDTEGKFVVWSPNYIKANEGLTLPAKVNYVAKGTNLYKHGYSLNGSIDVISWYLNTSWLWEQVRVKGGAYGGGCMFDQQSGVFSFYSYRDPNLLNTLDVYNQTSKFLRETELSEDELVKGIIGAIGRLDTYRLPDARGYTSMLRYLSGTTDELRQRIRDQILSTGTADFRAFADTLDAVRESGEVVILGGQAAIESAASERPGWLDVIKVM